MALKIKKFPFEVGRSPAGLSSAKIDDPTISRSQFRLESRFGKISLVNLSPTNPTIVDEAEVQGSVALQPGIHIIKAGSTVIGVGTDWNALCAAVKEATPDLYMARVGGREFGPLTEGQLVEACENGVLGPKSKVWHVNDPATEYNAGDLVDFGEAEPSPSMSSAMEPLLAASGEGAKVVPGENFRCPYCRTVSDLADLLAVSVSPVLLGDPVLGAGDQSRFLPTNFTPAGLAIDAEGGVCTESACPRCHMAIPHVVRESKRTIAKVNAPL